MITKLICLFVGYLFGTFQTGYFLAKSRGFDIRDHGSHSTGATNSLRVMGTGAGVMVLIGDALKAIIPCLAVRMIYKDQPDLWPLMVMWAGAGVIIGHCFPFYMGFKGGKGIASTVGVLIALDIRIAILWAIVFFTFAVASKYVSLGSIMAMIFVFFCQVFCLFRGLLIPGTVNPAFRTEYAVLAFVISGLAVWKHRSNIGRLLSGTESKVKVFTKGMDVGRK